jgi:hypothetical protein
MKLPILSTDRVHEATLWGDAPEVSRRLLALESVVPGNRFELRSYDTLRVQITKAHLHRIPEVSPVVCRRVVAETLET